MRDKLTVSPNIRFSCFTDDWKQYKLGDVFQERSERSGVGELISVTINSGVVKSDDLDRHDNSSKDKSNYKKVEVGDIAYNSMRMWQGASGYSAYSGILSPAYTVIIPNEGTHSLFYSYMFKRNEMIQIFKKNSQGLTSDTWNLKFAALSKIKINSPSFNEQTRIAEYLTELDNIIVLYEKKLELLKCTKKGLIINMFPSEGTNIPKIRFDSFNSDWERHKVGDLVISHNAGVYINKDSYGDGVNIIGVGNIYDGDRFDGEVYRLAPVNDTKFLLEENDLIYGESSIVPEGIARTMCVTKNGAGSAFAWHTRRVKLDNKIVNSHFATLEFNHYKEVRNYLMRVSTKTALTGMTTEGYFGAKLSLPSIEEQEKISKLFIEIDKIFTLHKRELDLLKNLKKSMLKQMFI